MRRIRRRKPNRNRLNIRFLNVEIIFGMKIFFDVFIIAELNRLSVGGRLHNFFNGWYALASKK